MLVNIEDLWGEKTSTKRAGNDHRDPQLAAYAEPA